MATVTTAIAELVDFQRKSRREGSTPDLHMRFPLKRLALRRFHRRRQAIKCQFGRASRCPAAATILIDLRGRTALLLSESICHNGIDSWIWIYKHGPRCVIHPLDGVPDYVVRRCAAAGVDLGKIASAD